MIALLPTFLLALGELAHPRILRVLAKCLIVSLLLFALLGWGAWAGLDWAIGAAGLRDAAFAGAGMLRETAALLGTILGLWLLWRIVALAVVQFYADDVVQAVEMRHYPAAAARAREPSVAEQVRSGGGAALRALLVNVAIFPVALALVFTGFGAPLLYLAVNAVLLGRELQDMVWLRHRHAGGVQAPVSRAERIVLGATVAAMLTVPFVNLIAPLFGAAAATHLIHRKGRS